MRATAMRPVSTSRAQHTQKAAMLAHAASKQYQLLASHARRRARLDSCINKGAVSARKQRRCAPSYNRTRSCLINAPALAKHINHADDTTTSPSHRIDRGHRGAPGDSITCSCTRESSDASTCGVKYQLFASQHNSQRVARSACNRICSAHGSICDLIALRDRSNSKRASSMQPHLPNISMTTDDTITSSRPQERYKRTAARPD